MGLLSSMLGGAAKSGMAMADKISTENRRNEMQDGLLEKKIKREDELLVAANAREDKQIKEANAFALRRDNLNHQRNLQLANIKNRTSTSNTINPNIKLRAQTLTDLIKNEQNSTVPNQDLINGYLSELNQLTKVGDQSQVIEKPSLETLNLKSRRGFKPSREQVEKEKLEDEQAKKDRELVEIKRRVDDVWSNKGDAAKAEVSRLLQKQNAGHRLSFDELVIVGQFMEHESNKPEKEQPIKSPEEQRRALIEFNNQNRY